MPDHLPDLSHSVLDMRHNENMMWAPQWQNSPSLKRPASHDDQDSGQLRAKRICGSGQSNSIVSSLSSSRGLNRENSMTSSPPSKKRNTQVLKKRRFNFIAVCWLLCL